MEMVKDIRQVKFGEIYFAKLSGDGSVQNGYRPVVVVSNDVGNANSSIVSIIPFTSKRKKQMPTHATIYPSTQNGLKQTSIALAEQITTINKFDLSSKVGSLSKEEIGQIQFAYMTALNVNMLTVLSAVKGKRQLKAG